MLGGTCRNASGPAWGDEAVRKEAQLLGVVEESGPDAAGIRTRVHYERAEAHARAGGPQVPPGSLVRITKRTKIVTREVRVPAAASDRAKWAFFGAALSGNEGTVAVSYDDIGFDAPPGAGAVGGGEVEKPKDDLEKLAESGGALIACRHCGKVGDHYTLKCPFKGMSLVPGEGGSPSVSASGGPSASSITASRAAEPPQEELTGLRVSNLSEDAEEDEIRALFGHYGRVHRLHLARDRDTGVPKGYAFVTYLDHGDAAAAMKALNGFPYQHLVLRVEWSKPRTDAGSSGGLAGSAYVSGYGKALPQSRGK